MIKLKNTLTRQVNILPLVYLRVVFGVVMIWEVWRYFDRDWVRTHYMLSPLSFPYLGLEWLQPLPGYGMVWVFVLVAVCGACIALGLLYRLAAILFTLAFTYIFLLEQTYYLNHWYLVCLMGFVLCWLPANHALAVDSWLRPGLRRRTVPAWYLLLPRFQVGIVYFYAGVAKLNADWLAGEPMRMWLAERDDLPLIGPYVRDEWLVGGFTYGGLLIDLLCMPLLMFVRWSRWPVMIALFTFHITNYYLFNIGIFPWLMILLLPLFLPAHWWDVLYPQTETRKEITAVQPLRGQRVIAVVLIAHVIVQILLPLRHHVIPGDVAWTEDGHKFSWRMKLRDKDGVAAFVIRAEEPRPRGWVVRPEMYVNRAQASEISDEPDMLLQFVDFLEREWAADGYEDVVIYARVWVSLNGREYSYFVDPCLNMTTVDRQIINYDAGWMMPPTGDLQPGIIPEPPNPMTVSLVCG